MSISNYTMYCMAPKLPVLMDAQIYDGPNPMFSARHKKLKGYQKERRK